MYYKFIDPKHLNGETILLDMEKFVSNKNDLPVDKINIMQMVMLLLPRKEETIYAKINKDNIAEHLSKCIPSEPIEHIRLKAGLNDPVNRI